MTWSIGWIAMIHYNWTSHPFIPKRVICFQCSIINSPWSQSMQWQPTVQAAFRIQIKVFNYTQFFDNTTLTSCSVAPYEQRQKRKHSERRGCLSLTRSECVIRRVHSNLLASRSVRFSPSKKHKKTAESFSTHLCLQRSGQHDIQYANEICCDTVCLNIWAVCHQGLTSGCQSWHIIV